MKYLEVDSVFYVIKQECEENSNNTDPQQPFTANQIIRLRNTFNAKAAACNRLLVCLLVLSYL